MSSTRKTPEHLGPAYSLSEAATVAGVTVAATAAATVAVTAVEVAATAAGVGGAAAEAVEAVETAGYGPPLVGFGPAIDNVFSKGAGNVGPLLMGIIAR